MNILVINGPNLNMLGIREREIYGQRTYPELVGYIERCAEDHGIKVEVYQSNHEGAIIDKIQDAYGKADAIIINGGGYTHTSIAIMDALKAVMLPAVEVHISDIHNREEFRKHSYLSLVCEKTICGLGFKGYNEAILYLIDKYKK
ncbi:MAG: type II 3-dehydroquinate dehydratase [Firmicutes bacterium]|nr:type II 3-dehydroquinate dehydratase [Bacillota bacterium]